MPTTTRRQAKEIVARDEATLRLVIQLSEHDTCENIRTTTQVDESSNHENATEVETKAEPIAPKKPATKSLGRVKKRRPEPLESPKPRASRRVAEKKLSAPPTPQLQSHEDNTPSTSKAATPRITRSRTKKDQPASAVKFKAQVSGRVHKEEPPKEQAKRRKKLMVKLSSVPYKRIDYDILKTWGTRRAKLAKDYWPYPHHPGFKLGHDPWSHLNWPAPNPEQIREVHGRLADHHKKFDFDSYVAMPAHATETKLTIDAVFQTLFAQSTDNEIAIDTHSRLCNAFPYLVDDQKYVGKMPNWHDIRLLERDELPAALQQGGFHEMRAGFVKEILDYVYQKNSERKANGKQIYEYEGNPPDAKDFVPGMLSMDWLMDGDQDNSDEAILGRLIQLSGIGIKSAMCVMAFSMKRPLFVVDVHVLRYAQWLGWVPRDANNVDWVAMYLHKHIPDDIKYDLHNQIWTHCANENSRESKTRAVICPFCGARPPARGRDVSKHVCPLADILPPLEKRWGKAYTLQLRLEEKEAAKNEMINVDPNEAQFSNESAEVTTTPNLKQQSIQSFVTGLLTPPSSPPESSMDSADSAQTDEAKDDISAGKKKTKKLNLKAKSHRFEDISKEQAEVLAEEGYYLWEFRPMDNTFMEEWGTFDKKPRYKWERATIMDKDVAVTWEYANNVLNHNHPHKWSRRSDEDISNEQMMTAMKS